MFFTSVIAKDACRDNTSQNGNDATLKSLNTQNHAEKNCERLVFTVGFCGLLSIQRILRYVVVMRPSPTISTLSSMGWLEIKR